MTIDEVIAEMTNNADRLEQLDDGDIGKNDIFEVIEVECSEEEWEDMASGDGRLVPADFSKRIVMSCD